MSQTSRKNIYLADDDAEDCEIFAEALKEVNAEAVLTASKNGHELMTLLNEEPTPQPDVIFLDLNMPIKNGYQCLKEIREQEALKDHIVIIFTTSSLKEDIEKLYEMGADLYITKPSDFERLKEVISKVLSVQDLKNLARSNRQNFILS